MQSPARPARATIADVARRAGISKAATSYALNGKAGVSEDTRQRVLAAARELSWAPSSAARVLAGSRTAIIGLTITRRPETLGDEPYLMAFVAGLASSLQPRGYGLLLQVAADAADELATISSWAGERRTDGVVVMDVALDDARPAVLAELGMPAVLVGHAPSTTGAAGVVSAAGVVTDDAAAMTEVVDHLAGLGHRRVGRVAGPARLRHTTLRDRAFTTAAHRHGMRAELVHTDYSGDGGARATADLVTGPTGATALVYDNDLMAVAGLSRLSEMGLRVPGDVSLVAWDDSATCRITHPPLTATGYDVVAYGRAAADALFALLDGEPQRRTTTTPRLRVRGSTGAPSSTGETP